MPEGMHGHPPIDAKLGRRKVDSTTDGIGAQLFVGLLPWEQELATRSFQTPVLAQSSEQTLGQRDQARSIALAVPNVDETRFAVDVAGF